MCDLAEQSSFNITCECEEVPVCLTLCESAVWHICCGIFEYTVSHHILKCRNHRACCSPPSFQLSCKWCFSAHEVVSSDRKQQQICTSGAKFSLLTAACILWLCNSSQKVVCCSNRPCLHFPEAPQWFHHHKHLYTRLSFCVPALYFVKHWGTMNFFTLHWVKWIYFVRKILFWSHWGHLDKATALCCWVAHDTPTFSRKQEIFYWKINLNNLDYFHLTDFFQSDIFLYCR